MSVLLAPRWGGTPSSDWYPWLAEQLDVPVRGVPLRPTPDGPTIEVTVPSLVEAIAAEALADTLLVAHSVGCQAMLRALARLPVGTQAKGLVAVAGWFDLDEPWDSIQAWVDTPVDTDRVRAVCPSIHVLLSDDDPFTADHVRNAATWRERLGAEVTLVSGARHFNRSQEPVVLQVVQRCLGGG